MKKILITGASGFIGGFLVKEALNRGYETWAGVRSTSSRVNLQDERIRFIDLKYSDRESLTAQLADFVREHGPWDYVIHNAGLTKTLDKRNFYRINAQNTANLIEALAASGCKPEKFLLMSSLSSYGRGDEKTFRPISLDDPQLPDTEYGKSKLEAENEGLKQDIANLQRQVQAEQREQTKMEHRHNSEINKINRSYQQKIAGYNNRLKQIDTYFPIVTELLPIAEQCREVGFTEELTRRIVTLQPVEFKGRLYSKEHREKFRTDHSTATVERNPQEKGKFRLCIDGMPILEWFRMKFQELKEKLSVIHTQKEEDTPKRGFRL